MEADDIIINGERINVKTVLDILHEEIRLVETEEFGHLKVWFEVPSTIGNAYVLTNLKFYSYDLLALVVCCSLIVLIIIVFVIYYLISFMHLLHTTRKTTKVIYTDMVTGGANQLFFEKKGKICFQTLAFFYQEVYNTNNKHFRVAFDALSVAERDVVGERKKTMIFCGIKARPLQMKHPGMR